MTNLTVGERLIAIISHVSGTAATRQAKLREELRLDSLDVVQAGIHIDTEFDVMLTDDELESCKTVGDLIAVVECKIAEDKGRSI